MTSNKIHPLLAVAVIVGIGMLIITLAPLPTDLVRNEARAMREEALLLASNGHTDKAIHKLQRLQKHYPDKPEILIDQLEILHNAGRNTALLDLFASLELQFASRQTIDMLVQAASANNAGYTLLYGASLDLLPASPYLATRLSRQLLTYNPNMANELLVEATRLAPTNSELQLLAAKSFRDRDYLLALDYIEDYLANNSRDKEALKLYTNLIIQHAQQQSPTTALSRIQKVTVAVDQTEYNNIELMLSAWADDFLGVQTLINDAQPQASVQDLVSVTKLLRTLNQPVAAERIGRTAIASHPQSTDLNIALAYALLDQKKINEAKQILATIENPESAPLQLAKASIAESLGNFDKALDYIESASLLDPNLMLTTRWSQNLLQGLKDLEPENLSVRIALWQNRHTMSLNDAFSLANSLRKAGFSAQATQLTIGAILPIPLQ
jgi:predicted Zn-dependent protease